MESKPSDHPWIGVDAIIADKDGKLLLQKRSKDSKVYPGMWSLVSGKMDWGETVEEALIREVKEETGYDIKVASFAGKYYDRPGRHPTKTIVCLPHYCEIIGGEEKLEEGTELNWFSPEQVKSMDLAFDHKEMLEDEKLI